MIITQAEKDTLWRILGKYKNERLKLDWYVFHPNVKIGAILIALLGPEPF